MRKILPQRLVSHDSHARGEVEAAPVGFHRGFDEIWGAKLHKVARQPKTLAAKDEKVAAAKMSLKIGRLRLCASTKKSLFVG